MRKGHPQRLGHDLGGRRRAEELAAAAGAGARPAAQFRGFEEGQLPVGVAGADGLDLARVLADARGEGHAARDDHAGQVPGPGQGEHHRREPLVAGGDSDDPLAARQRADQPAEDDGRVVSVGEAVHHAGRPLRPTVAGVGHRPGERDGAAGPQLLGRRADEQAHLPVPGVVAQRDRLAGRAAEPAHRAEDQERLAADLLGRPAHARILGQAEQVPGRPFAEHRVRQRQGPRGPIGGRLDLIKGRVGRPDDLR